MPSHDTRDLKLCSLLIIFSSEKIHHTYFLDFSEKGTAPVLLSAAVFLHMKWHVSCTISCSRMQVTSACRRTGGRAHFPIAPTLLVTHSSSHMSRTLLVTHFECNGGGAGDTVWELVATKSGQSSPKTRNTSETSFVRGQLELSAESVCLQLSEVRWILLPGQILLELLDSLLHLLTKLTTHLMHDLAWNGDNGWVKYKTKKASYKVTCVSLTIQ